MFNRPNKIPEMSGRLFIFIIIVLALLGLFNSFKISFALNGINADIGDTAMLWHGYQQMGWIFIKNWIYNIDNWLLSLLPLHFLLFEIFDNQPSTMLWFGYLVLIANAVLCGVIAYSLGARIAAIVVPVILLFSNYFSYIGGLLTFAISHNSTNLYGLICLLLTIKWVQKPRLYYLVIIFVAATVAGVSDPWFLPCYTAPIMLTQLILLKRPWHNLNENQHSIWLLATLLFALLAQATKLFGILYFITPTAFPISNLTHILPQALIGIKYIGWLFNLFPGRFSEAKFLAMFPGLLSFVIFFLLAVAIIIQVKRHFSANPAQLNFFLITLFSIIFIFISFCLLNQEIITIHASGARYLINILFLLILGIGLAVDLYWRRFTQFLQIGILIVGLLYLTASISSTAYSWTQPTKLDKNEYRTLINFLSVNGLSYGYAEYWKSVVTWLTHDQIRIRAVKFSNINGAVLATTTLAEPSYQQTSRLWYLPSNLPKNQNEFFIIVEKAENGCPDVSLCISTLTKQFGQPVKILHFEDLSIMVWPHPLLEPMIQGPQQ